MCGLTSRKRSILQFRHTHFDEMFEFFLFVKNSPNFGLVGWREKYLRLLVLTFHLISVSSIPISLFCVMEKPRNILGRFKNKTRRVESWSERVIGRPFCVHLLGLWNKVEEMLLSEATCCSESCKSGKLELGFSSSIVLSSFVQIAISKALASQSLDLLENQEKRVAVILVFQPSVFTAH